MKLNYASIGLLFLFLAGLISKLIITKFNVLLSWVNWAGLVVNTHGCNR